MSCRPRLFTNFGDAEGARLARHRRALAIEVIVRRDYLDDECDAADIALGVLESDESMFKTDEQIAQRVAALIFQA